nr:reverse transcriptase domain-containing protein [Tanacetum cinerariifolium]
NDPDSPTPKLAKATKKSMPLAPKATPVTKPDAAQQPKPKPAPAINLFPPLDNPELTIRRRSRTDPTLLNNSKMAAEGNSDLPVPDLRTMKELCQPSLNGWGGPIALISIQETNFGLKNDMIQIVQKSCQFHGVPGDDANKHLDKFLHVTLSIKVNGVTDDALRLYLFPHFVTHHATAWFDRLLRNSINTFEQMANVSRGTIKEETNSSKELTKIPQSQVVTTNEFTNFMKANDAILKNMQTNITSLTNSNLELKNMFGQFMKMNTASSSSSGTLPVVERETEATKDMVHPTNNGSTEDVQPPVVLTESLILNSEPVVAPIIELVASLVSDPRPNLRPLILYPSRLQDQKLCEKANDQREKYFQIFKDLNFNISFADALILMPKFGPSIKSLLTNKDKLYELARTPLNEHCLVVLLKKLLEKLGDPGKFLISYDFLGMAECLALADLGASINLMPLSVWNKLSFLVLSPTCMTLELTDRLISRPVGVAEDVFVKVGTFHFPADFVVVDFDADPRVPLILRRSFLKTERALIDVFEGELTLRVGKKAITFNLDQTLRYSTNYNDMTTNQIDVIDMACEEYSQEVLCFSDVISSSNPTPYYDLIVSTTSLTLTPFGNSDFLLEEVDAFLALEDDPTSPEVDQSYVDTEGDILLLKDFTNDDPSLPPPNKGNCLSQVHKELKICEAKSDKFSIDEPREVELKDLPPHLKYAFLEGNNKFLVIIAKDLSVEEKTTLITVLKSHKKTSNQRFNIREESILKSMMSSRMRVGFTIVENEENELISTRLVTGWHVCIDYRKLNESTRKDHFPLPFMDQMLERLAGNQYYYFLDGFARCMMAIFHDMIEKTMEVFMDNFSVFRNSFQTCLSHLEKMLKRCEDINLCLNWEKSHFMVKEGIVLGHKISKNRIEVDKAKVDVITKLPHPTTVKGIRSFLGHADFYRRFIQDFSKIARPMTSLFEKDTPFLFSKECVEAFQTLKRKLTKAPILISSTGICPLSSCAMLATLLSVQSWGNVKKSILGQYTMPVRP